MTDGFSGKSFSGGLFSCRMGRVALALILAATALQLVAGDAFQVQFILLWPALG
jgi:hypothetical protein